MALNQLNLSAGMPWRCNTSLTKPLHQSTGAAQVSRVYPDAKVFGLIPCTTTTACMQVLCGHHDGHRGK